VPSKKQRRRREKGRRHEYEYVYVDEEGQEVEVDEPEPAARPARKNGAKAGRAAPARGGRANRPVEPPSWRRVGRRALILAPVLVLLMYVLKPKHAGTGTVIGQALFFIVIFLPFSYVMDTMLYRSYLKRTGQAPPPRGRRAKEPDAKS
jgi:hypothetical protein